MSVLDMLRRFEAIVEAGEVKPVVSQNFAISQFNAITFTMIYRLERGDDFGGTLGFAGLSDPYLELSASDGRGSASMTSLDLGKIVFERDLNDEHRALVMAYFIKNRSQK